MPEERWESGRHDLCPRRLARRAGLALALARSVAGRFSKRTLDRLTQRTHRDHLDALGPGFIVAYRARHEDTRKTELRGFAHAGCDLRDGALLAREADFSHQRQVGRHRAIVYR